MLGLVLLLVAATAAEPCQQICQMNWEPVCGSDGHTYSNLCEIQSVKCLTKSDVVVQYAGECEEKCNLACQLNYEPVCGTDGKTYGNNCELSSSACLKKSNVKVLHEGECGKLNKRAVVSGCSMACQMNYEPVCGADGHTYGNSCELEQFNCMKKMKIAVAHKGEC